MARRRPPLPQRHYHLACPVLQQLRWADLLAFATQLVRQRGLRRHPAVQQQRHQHRQQRPQPRFLWRWPDGKPQTQAPTPGGTTRCLQAIGSRGAVADRDPSMQMPGGMLSPQRTARSHLLVM